jgi:hypothetical protein
MAKKLLCLMVAAVCLSACQATRDAGWSGDNAVPFDFARSSCEADVEHMPSGPDRDAAFEECMASNGWTRP